MTFNPWIIVVGALGGAFIGGLVSVLVSWLSHRNSLAQSKLKFAEERAIWAIEKRLDRWIALYGALEKLRDAVAQLRIQQAWKATAQSEGCAIPTWVLSETKAVDGFRGRFDDVAREVAFLDDAGRAEFKTQSITSVAWFTAKTIDGGVNELLDLEFRVNKFQEWVASQYRKSFDARTRGLDASGS